MQPPQPTPFNIEQYLREQKAKVDARLDELLPKADVYPAVIHEAMRYSVFAGGKRLRPILALATGEALGGNLERLTTLAAALEMIHTYSLIHDDLPAMDNDDFRRGQPTAHKKYGEAIAILSGDGLLTLAFQVLAEMPGLAESPQVTVRVIQRIARAIGATCGMVGGQVVDLLTQGEEFTGDELNYIHSAKTGALIQASVESAALLCEAAPETLEALGQFGSRIGLAFQIVDDVLDLEASSAQLGKTAGKDRANRKATYPSLYGLETSKARAKQLVAEAVEELAFLGGRAEVLRELAHFISIRRF